MKNGFYSLSLSTIVLSENGYCKIPDSSQQEIISSGAVGLQNIANYENKNINNKINLS